jgi:hypothetical protein
MTHVATLAALVAAVGLLGACSEQPIASGGTSAGASTTPGTTTPDPLPSKPADPEADDPSTGMNSTRPDSSKDLKQDLDADTKTGVGTTAETSRDPNH